MTFLTIQRSAKIEAVNRSTAGQASWMRSPFFSTLCAWFGLPDTQWTKLNYAREAMWNSSGRPMFDLMK